MPLNLPSISELDAVIPTKRLKFQKNSNDETRSEKRFVDVIQSSLRQAFDEDESLVIMGQDIAGYGRYLKLPKVSWIDLGQIASEILQSLNLGC